MKSPRLQQYSTPINTIRYSGVKRIHFRIGCFVEFRIQRKFCPTAMVKNKPPFTMKKIKEIALSNRTYDQYSAYIHCANKLDCFMDSLGSSRFVFNSADNDRHLLKCEIAAESGYTEKRRRS